jgi:hypothetical protein
MLVPKGTDMIGNEETVTDQTWEMTAIISLKQEINVNRILKVLNVLDFKHPVVFCNQ